MCVCFGGILFSEIEFEFWRENRFYVRLETPTTPTNLSLEAVRVPSRSYKFVF